MKEAMQPSHSTKPGLARFRFRRFSTVQLLIALGLFFIWAPFVEGVWETGTAAIRFDKNFNVTDYYDILKETDLNCAGGISRITASRRHTCSHMRGFF